MLLCCPEKVLFFGLLHFRNTIFFVSFYSFDLSCPIVDKKKIVLSIVYLYIVLSY